MNEKVSSTKKGDTTFLPENERNQRISTLRFTYFIIPAHLGRDSSGRWLRLFQLTILLVLGNCIIWI
jgi:hypothetical protein